jgi:prepilin-type N-terminal cleavage/methylation domain-containing protein/prepilin-type processing-associated H-X9-DG protein
MIGMNIPGRRRRRGFTLVELMVVVGVLVVLLSLLLPTMGRVREMARRTSCASNLRQLTVGSLAYASEDENGFFIPRPPNNLDAEDDFSVWYPKYIADYRVFVCPSTNNVVTTHFHLKNNAPRGAQDNSGGHSYEIRSWYWGGYTFPDGVTIPEAPQPRPTYQPKRLKGGPAVRSGRIMLLSDADDVGINNWPDALINNHGADGCNISFLDAHVEWVPTGKALLQAYMDGYYAPGVGNAIMNKYGLTQNGNTFTWTTP